MSRHQRTVGRQTVVGIGEVEHRHQHFLAIDHDFFQPDYVVGQRSDLLRGQAHTHRQFQLLLAGDSVVHQVLEQLLITGLASEQTLTGSRHHRLLDQALLVESVAQAFSTFVRVVAQPSQQIIRAHELFEVGQQRAGFNQILVRL
ncbi:hypothetical protein D3C81_528350 [compost metagenome]